MIDRRSTGVAPLGTQTRAFGRSGLPRLRQRVDDLDSLRLLVGQGLRRLAHRGHRAGRRVDGDRGGLLEHDAPPGHPDQRVHGAEVDRHATSEAHFAPPLW
jgi:hypothetical protein